MKSAMARKNTPRSPAFSNVPDRISSNESVLQIRIAILTFLVRIAKGAPGDPLAAQYAVSCMASLIFVPFFFTGSETGLIEADWPVSAVAMKAMQSETHSADIFVYFSIGPSEQSTTLLTEANG